METNALPKMEMSTNETGCCPKFDPVGWDGKILHFKDKKFLRAITRSVMHVPINMGSVFTRVQMAIEENDTKDPADYLVLSRDLSASEAEHLFAVDVNIPGEEMTTLSGDFLTRVFEGPYRHAKNWDHDMRVAATAAGHTAKRVFMFYTTCPRCARTYGKNYVVGFAEL